MTQSAFGLWGRLLAKPGGGSHLTSSGGSRGEAVKQFLELYGHCLVGGLLYCCTAAVMLQ